MQNSNNSSEALNNEGSSTASNSSNPSISNIPPFVSPHIGDVPMFGHGIRTPSERRFRPYQLRSIRRFATSRVDNRRRYKININLSSRILRLRHDARRTMLEAIADALQIENSSTGTSNRTESDWTSYNIELNVPNHDDSSLHARDDYNNDYHVNNVNSLHVNRQSAELNSSLVTNEESSTSWSGVFHVLQNIFQRNSSSENRE